MRAQINAIEIKLNDFTRNNPLLYFKELKVGTLWLHDIGTLVIAKLLAGDPIAPAELQAAANAKLSAELREIHQKRWKTPAFVG